jgi:hypothetical protein
MEGEMGQNSAEGSLKPNRREDDMPTLRRYGAVVVAALLGLGFFTSHVSAQGANGTDVIIQLRLAGDVETLPPIKSCLTDRLSQMPDVKVTTAPTDGTRFVVDVVATKNANKKISASVVVSEIFPMEQFRPRIKEGEDADALLSSIQYYTLLRLHEVVPARSYETFCLSTVANLGDKVLSREYTERND